MAGDTGEKGAYSLEGMLARATPTKIHANFLRAVSARDVRTAPWEQDDTDLVGPWKVQSGTGRIYESPALTSVDRVTGLAERIRIDNKTSEHVAKKFEESWLSRYPRPFSCCNDDGGEFTGWEFQKLLNDFGVKDQQPVATLPQMVFVKGCTKQLVMFYEL